MLGDPAEHPGRVDGASATHEPWWNPESRPPWHVTCLLWKRSVWISPAMYGEHFCLDIGEILCLCLFSFRYNYECVRSVI